MPEISIEAPRPAAPSEVARVEQAVEGFRKRKDTDLARLAIVSRGDVARVEGFSNLQLCISQLAALQSRYGSGSLGPALSSAQDALAGLQRHKRAFVQSFESGAEAVQYIYVGAVMALWVTVSLLVAEGVVFSPDNATGYLVPHVDESGAGRVAKSLVVSRLARFADAAKRKDFESNALALASRAEQAKLQESVWGKLAGVATLAGAGAVVGPAVGTAMAIGAAVGMVLGLLYLARDIAAWAYSSRTRAATWLDLQATYLEANAAALSPGKRIPKEKQLGYASKLRALADRVRIDAAEADREASRASAEDHADSSGPGGLRLI